jgi:hypothetical protein
VQKVDDLFQDRFEHTNIMSTSPSVVTFTLLRLGTHAPLQNLPLCVMRVAATAVQRRERALGEDNCLRGGGFVICDYMRKHGQDKICGINFVGAAVVIGPKAFGRLIGPGFLDNAPLACERDLPTSIAAMRRFLRACFVRPISQEIFDWRSRSTWLWHQKSVRS